jgi:hypothetical protein
MLPMTFSVHVGTAGLQIPGAREDYDSGITDP